MYIYIYIYTHSVAKDSILAFVLYYFHFNPSEISAAATEGGLKFTQFTLWQDVIHIGYVFITRLIKQERTPMKLD